MIPQVLYQPNSAVDRAGPFLDIISVRTETSTAAATTLSLLLYTVPKDRILVIMAATAGGQVINTPTFVQVLIRIRGEGQTAENVGPAIARAMTFVDPTGATGAFQSLCELKTQCWAPPGSQVRVRMTMPAGVSDDLSLEGNLLGVLIPRGGAASNA